MALGIKLALHAGNDLGDNLALGRRAVGEHRLACDVADGIDAAH